MCSTAGVLILTSAAAHPVFEQLESTSPFGLHFLFHTLLHALNPGGRRSANERAESHKTLVQSPHFDQVFRNIANYLIYAPASGLRNVTENHAIACLTAREGAAIALLNYSKFLNDSKLRIGDAVQKSTLDLVFEAMAVTLCNFCHEDAKVIRDVANFFHNCKLQPDFECFCVLSYSSVAGSQGTLYVKAGQLCQCVRSCKKDLFYYSQVGPPHQQNVPIGVVSGKP